MTDNFDLANNLHFLRSSCATEPPVSLTCLGSRLVACGHSLHAHSPSLLCLLATKSRAPFSEQSSPLPHARPSFLTGEPSILALVSSFDYVHNQCWIENSELYSTAAWLDWLNVCPQVVPAHGTSNLRRCRQLRAIAKGLTLKCPPEYKKFELVAICHDSFPSCADKDIAEMFMRKRLNITEYLSVDDITERTLRPMSATLQMDSYELHDMQTLQYLVMDDKSQFNSFESSELDQLSQDSFPREHNYCLLVNGSVIQGINPIQILQSWSPTPMCKFVSSEAMSNDLIFCAQQMESAYKTFHRGTYRAHIEHSTVELVQKHTILIKTNEHTQWLDEYGLLMDSPMSSIKLFSWWIPTIRPSSVSMSNFKFAAVIMRACPQ